VVWEAVSIFVGLFSIALAVYFGTRGLGGKFDLLGSNLGSKLDLLIEKLDSIKEDTSVIREKVVVIDGKIDRLSDKIDNPSDKIDNIKEDTSIIREKVTLIEGRTREGSPLDSFKGVVKKV
jgi:hypothetical protein